MKTSTKKYSDQELLQLLDRDPQEGMAAAVEQYTGILWHTAGQHLQNPEDIKECVNDAFLEFYLHRDRCDLEKGTVTAYLTQIVRNLSISRYRKNSVRGAAGLPEDIADPEKQLSQVEDRDDLERAMAALKPEDAEIIRMKYYGGMTVREIADSLGLPYETVKKRHQRSLSKLKLLLLGLLAALVLAALAACAYAVLRYFGMIPGYGISSDPQAQVYILDEAIQMETDDGRYELDHAAWLDNELYIQIKFYPSDPSFMARDDTITSIAGVQQLSTEILRDGEYFCTATAGSIRMGLHEAEHGTHWLIDFSAYHIEELPSPADELNLSFTWNGVAFSFRMEQVKTGKLSEYSYQMGDRGGLLAIPRLEGGRLIVSLYPLNTGEETLLPSILRGDVMEGKVGDITAVSSDGTELVGEFTPTPNMGNKVYFYDWDFGPAEPGEYTINVPYAYLSMPVEEPVTLHLDLERGQWSQEEFPVAGGTLSIEDCAPLESKLEELGQGGGRPLLVAEAALSPGGGPDSDQLPSERIAGDGVGEHRRRRNPGGRRGHASGVGARLWHMWDELPGGQSGGADTGRLGRLL